MSKTSNMFEMVFMNNEGDEEKIWRLFPDGIEAAYWAADIAREYKWSLIDVIPHGEKEVLS